MRDPRTDKQDNSYRVIQHKAVARQKCILFYFILFYLACFPIIEL